MDLHRGLVGWIHISQMQVVSFVVAIGQGSCWLCVSHLGEQSFGLLEVVWEKEQVEISRGSQRRVFVDPVRQGAPPEGDARNLRLMEGLEDAVNLLDEQRRLEVPPLVGLAQALSVR